MVDARGGDDPPRCLDGLRPCGSIASRRGGAPLAELFTVVAAMVMGFFCGATPPRQPPRRRGCAAAAHPTPGPPPDPL